MLLSLVEGAEGLLAQLGLVLLLLGQDSIVALSLGLVLLLLGEDSVIALDLTVMMESYKIIMLMILS